jgi:hypothetical protein
MWSEVDSISERGGNGREDQVLQVISMSEPERGENRTDSGVSDMKESIREIALQALVEAVYQGPGLRLQGAEAADTILYTLPISLLSFCF